MTSLAARAAMIAGYMRRPTLSPNVCAGTADLCDEIAAGLERAAEQCANLRAARAVADLPRMKRATGQIAATLAVLTRQQESLAQVLLWHAQQQEHDHAD